MKKWTDVFDAARELCHEAVDVTTSSAQSSPYNTDLCLAACVKVGFHKAVELVQKIQAMEDRSELWEPEDPTDDELGEFLDLWIDDGWYALDPLKD